MNRLRILLVVVGCLGWVPVVNAELKAGAAVIDISPPKLPVLVNGGMLSRYVDKINTKVHARAIVVSDGKEQRSWWRTAA